MRVSRIHLVLIVTLTLLVLSSSAFANSVSMTFEGQSIYHTNHLYYFSINGSSSFTALICDSYDNTIHKGESWQATVTPFLQGVGLFGSTMSLDYRAAGLIFKSILAGTTNGVAGQWAIWGLFSANAANNPLYTSDGGAAVAAQFLALAATAPNSAYAGLVLYTPINGSQGKYGLPQEFIGFNAVPEPGSLTLLGTGLIGLAGALRRKFARS